MNLEGIIEGVLFYRAEPTQKTELARLLRVTEAELTAGLAALRSSLATRGITLVETDAEVQLMTAPALAETIEQMKKEDLRRDIGKAGAETLAIVLYRGPLTRAEIDFIRGVNSNFVLRNLLMRGLVERVQNPDDQRSYKYAITPALLSHLGIARREELPQYQEVMDELDRYEREFNAETKTEEESAPQSETL